MHVARISTIAAGVALALGSCQQKPTGFPYRVTVSGCPTCFAVLESGVPDFATVDSAQLHNGQLLLKGTLARPGIYKVYGRIADSKGLPINAHIYLPADSVQLTILPEQQESLRFYQLYQQRKIGSYLRNTVVVSTSPKQKQLERYPLPA